MGLGQLRHGLGCRESFMMEDKTLLRLWFTPCIDMSFSTSNRTLKHILFLPPLKRQVTEASWVEDRDEHDMEFVCPFLLFLVLPANYYGMLTVSQPHPKGASWQGNDCEKEQAGEREEVNGLGTKLQRQLSPSGLRWHLSIPAPYPNVKLVLSKETGRDRQYGKREKDSQVKQLWTVSAPREFCPCNYHWQACKA